MIANRSTHLMTVLTTVPQGTWGRRHIVMM